MNAMTLTHDLGGDWHGHSGNAPCPVCQPERRRDQRGLSLKNDGGSLLIYCHKSRCEFSEILRALNIPADFSPDLAAVAKVERERHADVEKNRLRARRIWDHAEPIRGTKGEAYFRSRGITLDLPASLRWRKDILHTSGRWLSAVVADVQPTGGIHRTYFEKTGTRLKSAAKLMLGPCAGGAVQLADGPGALLVGEGVESTLSALQLLERPRVRAWAALSTSGMKALRLPPDPGELIVASDGDAPGRAAARVLADRATAAGWRVSIADPDGPDGHDWNDVRMARRMAA